MDCHDSQQSVLSFLRRPRGGGSPLLVVCNFTPVLRTDYIVGVPGGGFWRELANSDASLYGGTGAGNLGGLEARSIAAHGRAHSLAMTLPPLAVVMFKSEAAG